MLVLKNNQTNEPHKYTFITTPEQEQTVWLKVQQVMGAAFPKQSAPF